MTVIGLMPAATVTGIGPTSGSTAGGTGVTIAGTNFTGATAVDFGTTDCKEFRREFGKLDHCGRAGGNRHSECHGYDRWQQFSDFRR